MPDLPMDLNTSVFGPIYRRHQGQPRITAISQTDWPSDSQFHEKIVPAGYPAVFRFAPAQPAENRQPTLAWLRSTYGDFLLRVRVQDYASPQTYAGARQYTEMTLAEYVAYMESFAGASPRYAGNQALPAAIAVEFGIRSPDFYPAEAFEPPAFWLGASGSVTPLHKDSTDNFAFQMFGEKRWTLFPVRDIPFLSMSRPDLGDEMDFATSAIDLRKLDADRFPLFDNAKSISLTLAPGEMLYLPAGWAHFVETVTPALTINYWLSKLFFRSLGADGS